MDQMAHIRQTFFAECDEQLAELEAGLKSVQTGFYDTETLNVVFRAVHSIKGGAGSFDLPDLVHFAKVFEGVLDLLRTGKVLPDPKFLRLTRQAIDRLKDLVVAGREAKTLRMGRFHRVLTRLSAYLPIVDPNALSTPAVEFEPVLFDLTAFDDIDAGIVKARTFRIRFTPTPSLYAKGNDTAILLRETGKLGLMIVTCDASAVPTLENVDPEGAYCSWTIDLETSLGEEAIREIFDFVEWDSDFSIEMLTEADLVAMPPGSVNATALSSERPRPRRSRGSPASRAPAEIVA